MLSLLAFIIIVMYVITMAVLILWTCMFVLTNLIKEIIKKLRGD